MELHRRKDLSRTLIEILDRVPHARPPRMIAVLRTCERKSRIANEAARCDTLGMTKPNAGEKAARRMLNIVGTIRISRAPRRHWRQPKDDVPEALWLRLKPYVRLTKDRHEE